MAKFQYKTEPTLTENAPPGIWHILVNETFERFAYYGMTFILFTYMTEYLLGPNGEKMAMNSADAKSLYHMFKATNYAFPIIGALLSDVWLGKFKTIIIFSVLYCVGFMVLVVNQTQSGLMLGLLLIALGSGIIKPCVSANVGDQFGAKNKGLMSKIYNWFYFAINVGAYVGPVLTPLLLYNDNFGPKWAFGLTGVMMVFATVVFWIGRRGYVHAPAGGAKFVKECFSKEGLMAILKLSGLYVFIAIFWGLFEQTGSSWIEQAKKMDLHFIVDWKADQIPSSQAMFCMIMIPLFAYVVYPAMNKIVKLTPLRKIGIGLLVTASAFLIIVWIEFQLNGGFVVKETSNTSVAGYAPVNLLDNNPDSYWVSDDCEPNETNPQQILVQLREKKSWDISDIQITLAGQLTKKEILKVVDDNKKIIKKKTTLIKDANSADQMTKYANELVTEIQKSKLQLDYKNHHPKDIAVYIANNPDVNIPMMVDELLSKKKTLGWAIEKAQEKQKTEKAEKLKKELGAVDVNLSDYDAYLADFGFKYLGEILIDAEKSQVALDFDAEPMTHILLTVKSNYGGNKVRLAEIKAITDGDLPVGFDAKDADVWPNMAAVGFQPNIRWHFIGNIILTAAELLVSVTSLEFMYSQAPVQMKSFIMSIYLLAISLGNIYAVFFNKFVKNTRFESGPNYFILWIILCLGAMVVFVVGSFFYRGKTYIQGEGEQAKSPPPLPESEQ